MMEGEAVETCALSFPNPKNQNRGKNDFSSFLAAVANKVSTSLSDIRSKPWVFVSFGPSQKKEPFGGGEPRQARA
jgi:hypothetical protein